MSRDFCSHCSLGYRPGRTTCLKCALRYHPDYVENQVNEQKTKDINKWKRILDG